MKKKIPKTHLRSLRLFVNAGIRFPACEGGKPLLDMDKTRWDITADRTKVTCKKCLFIMAEGLA